MSSYYIKKLYFAPCALIASRIKVLNLSACHAARPVNNPSMDG